MAQAALSPAHWWHRALAQRVAQGFSPVSSPSETQHRLDLERRHEPAPRRVWRSAGAHAGARSTRQRIHPLHARVYDRAGLRAEPCGHHHRHVSERDWRAAHADDRRSCARVARAVPRRAAVLREGVSRVSARGRLLHQQSRENRLPVRRALHDLGRPSAPTHTGAVGPITEPAVLLGVQPRW